MPRGDGTGPAGAGSMTGRAAGFCAGSHMPGFANPIGGCFGRGMGWGRGFGRGLRWAARPYGNMPPAYGMPGYGPAFTPETEREYLQNQANALGEQLKEIQNRLSELESKAKEK